MLMVEENVPRLPFHRNNQLMWLIRLWTRVPRRFGILTRRLVLLTPSVCRSLILSSVQLAKGDRRAQGEGEERREVRGDTA